MTESRIRNGSNRYQEGEKTKGGGPRLDRIQKGHQENLYKVLILGDFEVGKSSLVDRYVNGNFRSQYKATHGVDFALKVLQWSDSETVRLQLWDIAGQERFTSMTRLYYREAAACVIMFDVTNRASYLNSQKWKEDLDSKATLPNGAPVPCILLANKCDLSPWAMTKDEVDTFSRENSFIGWTETSVKENKNINESMRVLVAKMMDNGEGVAALSGNGDYINLRDVATPGYGCC